MVIRSVLRRGQRCLLAFVPDGKSFPGTLPFVDGLAELLRWYRPRRRAYPWREPRPDPYRVLVSEVMLQQTQAARVAPAYLAFLERFPTVGALAAARRREVVRAWSGLGYNRRAVALSETARTVVRDHSGRIPSDPSSLTTLPGVGPYTAAAVASIAFGLPTPALDVNAKRVVARARLGLEPHRARTSDIRCAASGWIDRKDPGTWNQAVMDLGREVCRPIPRCEACPLASICRFRAADRPAPGAPPRRSQPSFQGSMRQVRGRVLRALGERDLTLGDLAARIGESVDRTIGAVAGLARDGLVQAELAAIGGDPEGSVGLADA
jgi:A/G-specific adenine glycosylase